MRYNQSLELFLSLATIRPENAADIIAGKTDYDENMVTLRQAFIKKTFGNNRHIAIINAALAAANEPPITEGDSMLINKELMDIAASGRSMQLHQRLDTFKAKELEQQPAPIEQASKTTVNNNPYLIAKQTLPANITADRKKEIIQDRLMRFIEFEFTSEIFGRYFPEQQSDLAKSWVNELFATNKNPTAESRIKTFEKLTEDEPMLQNQMQDILNELKVELLEARHQFLKTQIQTDSLVSRVLAAHKSNDPIFNAPLEGSLKTALAQIQKNDAQKNSLLKP